MKHVGVREFRDHATQYLAGDEILVVERNGRPIGVYIPAGVQRPRHGTQALDQVERTVEAVLAETGLSEDELSALFDLSRPVPEPHASGR